MISSSDSVWSLWKTNVLSPSACLVSAGDHCNIHCDSVCGLCEISL